MEAAVPALSEKQWEFAQNCTHRYNIKTGAVRSGKSYMDIIYTIPMRIRERLGKPGLAVILGVTKETIERNVLEPMRQNYGRQVGEIDSRNRCRIFGERVYCLGAEKVSQVSKLRGSSVKYCYWDEMADCNQEVFELLKSRLDRPYSCLDGALNPQGPNHWLKEFLDSEGRLDIYCQKYTIFDNPFLDPVFVDNLCREYEGSVYYKRYILGEWALAEGLVYPMFSREKHVVSGPVEYRRGSRYYVSVDYGTVNPFAAGIFECNGRQSVMIKELHYDGRKNDRVDNEAYYQMLCGLIGDLPVEYIVVDPSAAGFIETIKKYARFIVKGADNDVLNGIQEVTKYLNYGLLKIHESCVETIKEFQQYAWDDKHTDEDVVIKESDHHMDLIRYYIYGVARQLNRWII